MIIFYSLKCKKSSIKWWNIWNSLHFFKTQSRHKNIYNHTSWPNNLSWQFVNLNLKHDFYWTDIQICCFSRLILFGQVVQFSAANRDEQIFTLTSDFGQFKILKQTKANYLAKFFGRKGKAGTYFALFAACRTFELRGKPHISLTSLWLALLGLSPRTANQNAEFPSGWRMPHKVYNSQRCPWMSGISRISNVVKFPSTPFAYRRLRA